MNDIDPDIEAVRGGEDEAGIDLGLVGWFGWLDVDRIAFLLERGSKFHQ